MSRIKLLVPDTVNEFDEIDFKEYGAGAAVPNTYESGS